MWTELIKSLPGETHLHPGVSDAALQHAQHRLGHPLPDQLTALLRETDGVDGEYGLGLMWPLNRIVADNLTFRNDTDFRQLYMPFDPLLFVADAGNGDQFALVPHLNRPDVYAWDHENDSRTWVAPGLDTYLTWWLTGKITL